MSESHGVPETDAIEQAYQTFADLVEATRSPYMTGRIEALRSQFTALRARLEAAERENKALRGFAGAAIKAVRGPLLGCDWDGGDVQDAMVAAGLLALFEVTEPCGENCVCAEVGFDVTCYRLTDLGQRCEPVPSDSGATP